MSLIISHVNLNIFRYLVSDISENFFIYIVKGFCNEYCVCLLYLYTKLFSASACTTWKILGGQIVSDVLSQHKQHSEKSVGHLHLCFSQTLDNYSTFLWLIKRKDSFMYSYHESLKSNKDGVGSNNMLSIIV